MTMPTALPLMHRRRRRIATASLLGIGLASPPALAQDEILQLVLNINPCSTENAAFIKRIFRNAGVHSRGSVLLNSRSSPTDFYLPASNPTTGTRMQRYATEAPALSLRACQSALKNAACSPSQITHLFTASCTGFTAPGLDGALIEHLGLSAQVRRLHIGFMGCHAAFNLLAAARDALAAHPQARVLICCVELCSLHLAYGCDPGKLIANALFADGAAAAVIGTPSPDSIAPPHLAGSSSMLIPHSKDAMTWNIGDHGFEMTLSPGVPKLIETNLRPWCEKFLAGHDLKIADIAHWAIHPGGPKVLSAAGQALNLSAADLLPSTQILAEHGNMSSATILFILQKIFAQNLTGPVMTIGLGPGLMAEGILFNHSLG